MVLLSFLLSLLAGLSTMLGACLILICKKKYFNTIIPASLAFASSIMLLISTFDLIPESYRILKNIFYDASILYILIFINIGIIISSVMDKYIPTTNNKLYRVGVVTMITIIIHNIPEGMATFIAANSNINLGIKLALAITLHNIPEGISIAIPIYYSTNSKRKAFLYTFISGISEFIGAIITYLFLKPFINLTVLGMLFAIIAGLMLYISINNLLKTSLSYKKLKISLISYIIGVLFFLLSILK